ncbi:hypothetical protein [Chitinophaga nivalis]|uniref:Adhesin domain-containing protein n=1 Tax=Chitinophaga nivalis TaxID=2991709 RepID=A0ABT3IPS8_9BACT|nr:hypothetical protein [Chitinophaga nivalis]MCW3464332.1 hypothetical protein [Chitinophaga nivalis]MCW3485977.1 hypothetical protein [Chitinophaga nivalis]
MKLKFKYLLFLLCPLLVQAENRESTYKKVVTKEFAVGNKAVLNISNKYGKVVLHTWEKNEIKAVVTITGWGKKDSEAKEVADMVDIAEEKVGNSSVILRTVYNPGSQSSGWFSWGNKKESKDYVNIDYDVFVPQSMERLIVENKFGDVLSDKFSFPVELRISYGNFDIREADDLVLKIAYCDRGRVGRANNLDLKSSYSTVRVEQVGVVELHSSYSEYNFTKVDQLRLHCAYDDIKTELVGKITGTCTYTDIKAGELQQDISLKMLYGDVLIRRTGNGLKGADLTLNYSDLKFGVLRKQSLSLDIYLVYGDLSTGGLEFRNVVSNKKGNIFSYSAQSGTGSDPAPIKIKGSNCDIKFLVL